MAKGGTDAASRVASAADVLARMGSRSGVLDGRLLPGMRRGVHAPSPMRSDD